MGPKTTRNRGSRAPSDPLNDPTVQPGRIIEALEEESDTEKADDETTPDGTTGVRARHGDPTENGQLIANDETQAKLQLAQLHLRILELQEQLNRQGDLPVRQGSTAQRGKSSFPLPPMFKGDTMAHCKVFLYKFREFFKEDPERFVEDEAKVRNAAARLEGKPMETWMTWCEAQGGTSMISWEMFETFCHDCVEDPVQRALKAGENFWSAKQKQGQTITAFAAYLEQCLLETRVGATLPEEWKAHALLYKATTKLRMGLWARMPQRTTPGTWKEMLEQLQLAESVLEPAREQATYTQGRGHQGKRERRTNTVGEGQPSAKNARTGSGSRSGSGANAEQIRSRECFRCGEEGHQARSCKSPWKDKMQGNQGKDQARLT
jgi:Zinc knuckle